jgi:hypothetical protein
MWVSSFGLAIGEQGDLMPDTMNILYITFLLAVIINVILMLNMIISILGDSFDEFQVLANYYDNREMTEVILEIEQIVSLFKPNEGKKYLHICENYYQEEEKIWEGKVIDMRTYVKNSIIAINESQRVTDKKIETEVKGNMLGLERRINAKIGLIDRGINGNLAELEGNLSDVEKKIYSKIEDMKGCLGNVEDKMMAKIGEVEAKVAGVDSKLDAILALLQK